MIFFCFQVFDRSGFTQTLCWSLAFSSSTGSTGRLGCCPSGSYMSSPNLDPFSIEDSCTTCPNGWYSRSAVANDDTSCFDNCPSGRYIKGTTIGAFLNCTICPSGKYQPSAHQDPSIACTTCIGSYIIDDGHTESEHNSADDCKRCPAGKEYVSTTTECTVCNAGKYQSSNTVANATCVPCDAGRYIVDDGQNVADHDSSDDCKFCPAGTEFVSTIETCRVCSFSKFQDQTGVPGPTCQTCPSNTFITDNGVEDVAHDELADCNACADGTVSNPGDQSCATCPAGKRVFTNNQGVAGCDDCSAGKYQSVAGEPNCKSCPAGWYQTKIQQPFCLPW